MTNYDDLISSISAAFPMSEPTAAPVPNGPVDMPEPPALNPGQQQQAEQQPQRQFPPGTDPYGMLKGFKPTYTPADFEQMVHDEAVAAGIDPKFALRIYKQEGSKGNPRARSPKGAIGLMQLMPDTGKKYGYSVSDLYDPEKNIRAGISELREQLLHTGSKQLGAAGYNAGGGAVTKYGGVPPYAETRQYTANTNDAPGNDPYGMLKGFQPNAPDGAPAQPEVEAQPQQSPGPINVGSMATVNIKASPEPAQQPQPNSVTYGTKTRPALGGQLPSPIDASDLLSDLDAGRITPEQFKAQVQDRYATQLGFQPSQMEVARHWAMAQPTPFDPFDFNATTDQLIAAARSSGGRIGVKISPNAARFLSGLREDDLLNPARAQARNVPQSPTRTFDRKTSAGLQAAADFVYPGLAPAASLAANLIEGTPIASDIQSAGTTTGANVLQTAYNLWKLSGGEKPVESELSRNLLEQAQAEAEQAPGAVHEIARGLLQGLFSTPEYMAVAELGPAGFAALGGAEQAHRGLAEAGKSALMNAILGEAFKAGEAIGGPALGKGEALSVAERFPRTFHVPYMAAAGAAPPFLEAATQGKTPGQAGVAAASGAIQMGGLGMLGGKHQTEAGEIKRPTLSAKDLEEIENLFKEEKTNATQTGQVQGSPEAELRGVRTGTNVPENGTEVRQGQGQQAAGRGGAEQRRTIQTEAPSLEEYVDQSVKNLQRTNFGITMKGEAAQPGKEALFTEGTEAQAVNRAEENTRDATKFEYENRDRQFTSPEDVLNFADDLSRIHNQGILKEDAPVDRKIDSKSRNYTTVENLPQAKQEFAKELLQRLTSGEDPRETAAWIEWRANYTDHFWSDASGRTARSLAEWILIRNGDRLPDAVPMKSVEVTSRRTGESPEEYDGPDWQKFHDEYMKGFENGEQQAVPESVRPGTTPGTQEVAPAATQGQVPETTGQAKAAPKGKVTWRDQLDRAVEAATQRVAARRGESGFTQGEGGFLFFGGKEKKKGEELPPRKVSATGEPFTYDELKQSAGDHEARLKNALDATGLGKYDAKTILDALSDPKKEAFVTRIKKHLERRGYPDLVGRYADARRALDQWLPASLESKSPDMMDITRRLREGTPISSADYENLLRDVRRLLQQSAGNLQNELAKVKAPSDRSILRSIGIDPDAQQKYRKTLEKNGGNADAIDRYLLARRAKDALDRIDQDLSPAQVVWFDGKQLRIGDRSALEPFAPGEAPAPTAVGAQAPRPDLNLIERIQQTREGMPSREEHNKIYEQTMLNFDLARQRLQKAMSDAGFGPMDVSAAERLGAPANDEQLPLPRARALEARIRKALSKNAETADLLDEYLMGRRAQQALRASSADDISQTLYQKETPSALKPPSGFTRGELGAVGNLGPGETRATFSEDIGDFRDHMIIAMGKLVDTGADFAAWSRSYLRSFPPDVAEKLKPYLNDLYKAASGRLASLQQGTVTVEGFPAKAAKVGGIHPEDLQQIHDAAIEGIRRHPSGNDEQQDIQRQLLRDVLTKPQVYIDRYRDRNSDSPDSKIIDVDRVKEIFPLYRSDRARWADGVQAAASFVAKADFYQRLNKLPEEAHVEFRAGGPSSGKTTSIATTKKRGAPEPDLVFDSMFADPEGNRRAIEAVLQARPEAVIDVTYVHRPVALAAKDAIARAMPDEAGEPLRRPVPEETLANGHYNAQRAFLETAEAFKDDPRVRFHVLDNSGELGRAKEVDIDFLRKNLYDSKEKVLDEVRRANDQAYRAGDASEAVYSAVTAGRSPSERESRKIGPTERGIGTGSAEQPAKPRTANASTVAPTPEGAEVLKVVPPTVTHYTTALPEKVFPGGFSAVHGENLHGDHTAPPGTLFTTAVASGAKEGKLYGPEAVVLKPPANARIVDLTRPNQWQAMPPQKASYAIKDAGYDGYLFIDKKTGEKAIAWFYPQRLRTPGDQGVFHTGTATTVGPSEVTDARKPPDWVKYNHILTKLANEEGVNIARLDLGPGGVHPSMGWWAETPDAKPSFDTTMRVVLTGDPQKIQYIIAKAAKIADQKATIFWKRNPEAEGVITHVQLPVMSDARTAELISSLKEHGIQGGTVSDKELIIADMTGGKLEDALHTALNDFTKKTGLKTYVADTYNADISLLDEAAYKKVISDYESGKAINAFQRGEEAAFSGRNEQGRVQGAPPTNAPEEQLPTGQGGGVRSVRQEEAAAANERRIVEETQPVVLSPKGQEALFQFKTGATHDIKERLDNGNFDPVEFADYLADKYKTHLDTIIEEVKDREAIRLRPAIKIVDEGPDNPNVWLLPWRPHEGAKFEAEGTPVHGHGDSSVAIRVLRGEVTQNTYVGADTHGPPKSGEKVKVIPSQLQEGVTYHIGAPYVHDFVNTTDSMAATLHIYNPALYKMEMYRVEPDGTIIETGTWEEGKGEAHPEELPIANTSNPIEQAKPAKPVEPAVAPAAPATATPEAKVTPINPITAAPIVEHAEAVAARIIHHERIPGDLKVVRANGDGTLTVKGPDGKLHRIQNPRGSNGNQQATFVKPEVSTGGPITPGSKLKERSLPKTLEEHDLEPGNDLYYWSDTLQHGVAQGRATVKAKGIRASIEHVLHADPGIDWAPTAYATMDTMRNAEYAARQKGDFDRAAKLLDQRIKFVGDFAARATSIGQSIAGIRAIEEFAPQQAVVELNRMSRKTRNRDLSPGEMTKAEETANELGAANDAARQASQAAMMKQAEFNREQPASRRQLSYQDALDEQGRAALKALKGKTQFDFGNLEAPSERGAVTIGEPPLPGDAETLAQYAASRLQKAKTIDDLNTEITNLAPGAEPYLAQIRRRAYAIREEARANEVIEAGPTRRKTVLQEIQSEVVAAAREQREAEAALRAKKREERRFTIVEAKAAAGEYRAKNRAELEAIAADARERFKAARHEYLEAAKADKAAYRADARAQLAAERHAKLWDTPIRNEAIAARERLKNADPKSPETLNDLISVAADKMLPEKAGGLARFGARGPGRFYREMADEFPNLFNKSNREQVFKRAFERVQASTDAAREAARLASGNRESRAFWENAGIDIDTQAILIRRAEAQRRQTEARSAMIGEFARVSRSPLARALNEIQSVPRALQSSIDAPIGRQGLFYTLTHPVTSLRATIPATYQGYRSWSREEFARHVADLQQHPDFELFRKSGGDWTVAGTSALMGDTGVTSGEVNPLHAAEEPFQSALVARLPHVRLSDQGFNLPMNAQRLALFSRYADLGRAEGYTFETNPEYFKQAAKLVNIATGRGSLSTTAQAISNWSNWLFYSTRLNVSRAQLLNQLFNPVSYKNADPLMRRIRAGEAVRLAAGLGVVYATAKAAGMKVTFDPDDSDFMKLRVGNTRYDPTGGEGNLARFLIRMSMTTWKLLHEAKTVQQKRQEMNALESQAMSYARFKFAPWPAAGVNLALGEGPVGHKPSNLHFLPPTSMENIHHMTEQNEAVKMVVPFIIGDFIDALESDGWLGVPKSLPGFTGISQQNYEDDPEIEAGKRRRAAAEMRQKAIENLRKNPNDTKLLDDAVKAQEMTEEERKKIIGTAALSPLTVQYRNLPMESFLIKYRKLPPDQQKELQSLLDRKWDDAIGAPVRSNKTGELGPPRHPSLPPAEIERLRTEFAKELRRP